MRECPGRHARNVLFTETPQTANNDACNKVTSRTRAFAKLTQHLNRKKKTKINGSRKEDNQNKGLHKTSFHKSQTDDRMVMFSACSPSTQKKRLTAVILLPFKFKFLSGTIHKTGIGCVRMIPSHSIFRNTAVT